MSHTTEQVDSTGLTSDEKKILANLLQHPEIRKMADEVEKDKDK